MLSLDPFVPLFQSLKRPIQIKKLIFYKTSSTDSIILIQANQLLGNYMPKKIKVFTDVPVTTLGDAAAAKKMLDLFKDEKDIEIEWVIVRDQPITDKALTTFVNPNIKVTNVREWSQVDMSSYNDADMFMIYPRVVTSTDHSGVKNLSNEFKAFLSRLPQDKTLLSCTEYNGNIHDHELIKKSYPFVQRLDTGFRKLGVFMEPTKSNAELYAQFLEKERKFADILFGSQSEEKYFDGNHLYCGYLNTACVSEVSDLNKVDRHNYVLNCIRDALHANREDKSQKDIDIVVDVNKEMLEAVLKDLTADERAQLGNITCVSKDKTENVSMGKGFSLRIINPFPVSHSAMLYMQARSNPLTMCTGDQSFTEALSYNKLALYQIMNWKEDFFINS